MEEKPVVLETPIRKGEMAKHYNKIGRLYGKGLKKSDCLIIMQPDGSHTYRLEGTYPGGEAQLRQDWEELNNKFGPCELKVDVSKVKEDFESPVKDVFESNSFEVISVDEDTYNLRYNGPENEANEKIAEVLHSVKYS